MLRFSQYPEFTIFPRNIGSEAGGMVYFYALFPAVIVVNS